MPLFDTYSKTIYLPNEMTTDQINKIPKVKVSSAGTYHIYDRGLSVYRTKDLEELKQALGKYFTLKSYDQLPIEVQELDDKTFLINNETVTLPQPTSPHFLAAYLLPSIGHPIRKNQLHHHVKKILSNKKATFVEFLEDPINTMLKTYKTALLLDGKIYLSLLDVAKVTNIKHVTLRARMRAGLSLEDAIKKPFNEKKKFQEKSFTHNGVHYNSYREFADKFNLNYEDLIKKINNGKSLDDYLERHTYLMLSPKPVYEFGEHTLQLRRYDHALQFYLDGEISNLAEVDQVIGFENILQNPDLHPFVRKHVEERFKWTNSDGDVFYSLSQIANYYDVSINSLTYRVNKQGLTIEDALDKLLS